MFERIVIREIDKFSGERMRILFDLNTQGGIASPVTGNRGNLKDSRKIGMRSATPVDSKRRVLLSLRNSKWKSPRSMCRTPDNSKCNSKSAENEHKKKRNISEELLDGIDKKMKSNQKFRLNQPGKLKFFHKKPFPKLVLLKRVSIFDRTVPECIIIESKSPVIKK